MDRNLIALKFTLLRNSSKGLRMAGWISGAVLVLATWAAALFAAGPNVRSTVLALAFAGWGLGAALGPVLMSGTGLLRPDYFALLPIERRRLGRGLLLSVFVSIASAFVLLAFLSSAVHAWLLSPATVILAVAGAPLTWIFAVTLSRLVYGLLGAAMRSKLGVEIAAIQFGLMFAVMFTGWMVAQVAIQTVPALLSRGIEDTTVNAVLNASPTSWPILAMEQAAAGDWTGGVLLLGALAALDAILIAATIALLTPRTDVPSHRPRGKARSRGFVAGGGILPATQMGAVISKEVRQWWRDPWRALELRTAVWTGIAIGGFALASGTYAGVSGFAGLIVAAMLGLSACNLYGQDGTAVWQNIVGQDATSIRADVRGRQWATLLVFLPQALFISVLFVLLSRQWWAIPFLLAALPATFGAACGAAILMSATGVSPGVDPRRRVGPNDANGNISIHVWLVILAIFAGTLPTSAMITLTALDPSAGLTAAAVVVGIANGWLAAWAMGRVAIAYLSNRMPDIFSRIRYGQVFRADNSGGVLQWVEATTLKGEQTMREQQKKQREERVEAAKR
ncbi:hypothetical protein ACIQH5_15310 [Paenarthrobacter sp. NPDC091711]|uniref:hypothetical protein n=1 Tax=Paenarthrobacter sp. NPDC091711 TaxID=3364385 RepID=UPI003813D51F